MMEANDALIVFVTASSEEEAATIAHRLVSEKLAACANLLPPVRSIYSWQGTVSDETEILMIIKTKKALFDKLAETVRNIHSYDTPEIIGIPVTEGTAPYLAWIDRVTLR